MKENSINNNFIEENHKSRNLRNIKRISYYEDISVDDEIEDDYNQKEENLKSKSLHKRKRSPIKENSENESEINTNINKNEISKEKKNYSNLGTIINIKDLKVPLNNTQIILMFKCSL